MRRVFASPTSPRMRLWGAVLTVWSLLAAALPPLAASESQPSWAAPRDLLRVAGPDRFATAAAISLNSATAPPVAFLATGEAFPDALTGGVAAALAPGPVLLTSRGTLPEPTRAELDRLRPPRLVVLGGAAAVSDTAATQAALAAGTAGFERLSGPDRFATAAAIAQAAFASTANVVFLATGEAFPDALAGGIAAAQGPGPVLLTGRDVLPEATRAELVRLAPERLVVLGGTAAVSDAAAGQAAGAAGLTSFDRLSGANRFATAAAISQATFGGTVDTLFIATGESFPDALAGVPWASTEPGPLLLTGRDALPDPTIAELRRLQPRRVVVFGGPAAVSEAVFNALRVLLDELGDVPEPEPTDTPTDDPTNTPTDGPTDTPTDEPTEPADVQAPAFPDESVLNVSDIGTTSLKLAWPAAADNVAVVGYRLYRNGTAFEDVGAGVRSRLVTGLAPDTDYRFRVEAFDEAGNVSTNGPQADVATAAGPADPPPANPQWPGGAQLTAAETTMDTTVLSWPAATDDVAVTGYEVRRDGVLLLTTPGDATEQAFADLQPGQTYGYSVRAVDGEGNRSTALARNVTTDTAPAPPVLDPPDLDPTQNTTMIDAASFLYTGADPPQSGVEPGDIEPLRVAVLRGRVLDRAGAALPGVTVSVADRPEFGQTISRADGGYDLAVNGGDAVTLHFDGGGVLPAQRTVEVPWQDWVTLDDVVLTRLDPAVTVMDLASLPADRHAVAEGSLVSDADGDRQGRLLFPAGTTAAMEFADGSPAQALEQLTVRISEFTVGQLGLEAMPAELPSTSAYTYAVELSADEAVAAGASRVLFNQPVLYYAENFLGFPVGGVVPQATYDLEAHNWVPEPDGRVIEILSIVDGIATLDADGDGGADAGDAGLDPPMTEAERRTLAALYQVGDTLQRVPRGGFSTPDFNLALVLPDDAGAPDVPGPRPHAPGHVRGAPGNRGHGDIDEVRQTIVESIAVPGTGWGLHYASDRTPGYGAGSSMTIPVTGTTIHDLLERVTVEVEVAGTMHEQDFEGAAITPEKTVEFAWDGTDAYGRAVHGSRQATVTVTHHYQALYSVPAWAGYATATFGLVPAIGYEDAGLLAWPESRRTVGRGAEWHVDLMAPPPADSTRADAGLGGWTLTPHHRYDPNTQTVWRGDGTRFATAEYDDHGARVIAGVNANCTPRPPVNNCGDGGPAVAAVIGGARAMAAGPDGSVYVPGGNHHRVRRIRPDGTITSIAGTGFLCDPVDYTACGDGGPATSAKLGRPLMVATGADGSLYVYEIYGFDYNESYDPNGESRHRIRRIGPDGIITTVAGTGVDCHGQPFPDTPCDDPDDGVPATQANIWEIQGMAVADDGTLYVAEKSRRQYVTNSVRIRRIGPDGRIHTIAGDRSVAGCHWSAQCGDGGPAAGATFSFSGFHDLALGPDGSLYAADDRRVRRIAPSGTVTSVAGTTLDCAVACDQPDEGVSATSDTMVTVNAITATTDGRLYIVEGHRVRLVTADGIVRTVAGLQVSLGGCPLPQAGACDPAQQQKPARSTDLSRLDIPAASTSTWPYSVQEAADGSIVLRSDVRIMRVEDRLPDFDPAGMLVPEADGGVGYEFDGTGRHLRTVNLLTRATLLTFSYDAGGRLAAIEDADGNITSIARPTAASATVTGPFGQTTAVGLDANGWLDEFTDPSGSTFAMTTTAEGLLTDVTGPRAGTTYSFAYDAAGRISSATRPGADPTTFAHTALDDRDFMVTVTSPQGRVTVHTVTTLDPGGRRLETLHPDGTTTVREDRADGTASFVGRDGVTLDERHVADTRFGMSVPVLAERTITTPDGLVQGSQAVRGATLADAGDPFSLVDLTDTLTVNGDTATWVYDAGTRTAVVTTAEGRQVSITTDQIGRLVSRRIGTQDASHYAYDTAGRLVTVTQGDGVGATTSTWGYDPGVPWPARVTDAAGGTTEFTYDPSGRLLAETRADGEVVTYAWDAHRNLTGLTPPQSDERSLGYDLRDRLGSFVEPDAGAGTSTTTWSYDADGPLAEFQRADGSSVAYPRDGATGRPAGVELYEGGLTPVYTAAVSYDPGAFLPTGVSAAGGAADVGITQAWDGPLPLSESWTYGAVGPVVLSRAFDHDFRSTGDTVAGQAVAYTYDSDGLLVGAGTATITRTADTGLPTGVDAGGFAEDWTYDSRNRIVDRVSTHGGSLLDQALEYDELGRVTRLEEAVEGGAPIVTTFGYDAIGRLESVAVDDGVNPPAVRTYTYDTNGNRLTGPGGFAGIYDARDRITSDGSATYVHDEAGDVVSRTTGADVTTYDYDALGNLRGVVLPDGTEITYVIDGLSRRVGRAVDGVVERLWVYDGQLRPIAELDAGGNLVARFVYGVNALAPDQVITADGTVHRVVADHTGSPRLVVRVADGVVVQRLDYDEFGQVLTDTNPGFQPFAFQGGLYDLATGLVRFGARDYDPATGRFLTRDPALYGGGQTNLYTFVDGDPVNRADPTGLGPAAPVGRVHAIYEPRGLYRINPDGTVDRLAIDDHIYVGDVIHTRGDSFGAIEFYAGGQIQINKGSGIVVTGGQTGATTGSPFDSGHSSLGLAAGLGMWGKVATQEKPLEIRTSSGVMGGGSPRAEREFYERYPTGLRGPVPDPQWLQSGRVPLHQIIQGSP